MFLLEKTCHCLKSMSNDFSITHILITNFFTLKYQSIFKFLFFCAYVTTMILWPIWLHSWAHGAFVPISKLFTCHKTLRQPQVTALQYHFHTASQGDNRHHKLALGMRYMYCSWLFCALLCSIVHLFVHYCALLCIYLYYCACKKQVNGPDIE